MTDDKYKNLVTRLNEISYELLTSKEEFLNSETFIYKCPLGHSPLRPISLLTMNNTFRKRIDNKEPFCVTCRKLSMSVDEINTFIKQGNFPQTKKEMKILKKANFEEKETSESSEDSKTSDFTSNIKLLLKSEEKFEIILKKCCEKIKEKYSISYSKLSDKKEFNYSCLFSFKQKELFSEVYTDICSLGKKIPKTINLMLKNINGDERSFYHKIIMEFLASEYSSIQTHKMIKFFFERTKYKKNDINFMIFDYQEEILDKLLEERKHIFCGLSDSLPILQYDYEEKENNIWYPDFYIAEDNLIIDVYSRELFDSFLDRIKAKVESNKEFCNIEIWIVNKGKSIEIIKHY